MTPKAHTPPTGWIGNADQMAVYAGVSKRSIVRWIAEGRLKVRHLSKRKIVCRPADLDRAIASIADAYEMEGSA